MLKTQNPLLYKILEKFKLPIKEENTYKYRKVILMSLGFNSYLEYRKTILWKEIKRKAFREHGHICRLCNARATVIHHIKYTKEVLLGKNLIPLVPLCDNCHYKVEFFKGRRKRSLYNAQFEYARRLSYVHHISKILALRDIIF